MLEEEIQKMIKEEVEKVLHPLIQNIATYAETNQTQLLSLKNRLDENIKQTQELLVILKKELDATNYKNLALAIKGQPVTGTTYPKDKPPVTKEELKELEKDIDLAITKTKKTVPYKEEIGTEEPEPEPEEEEAVEYPREWVKEQEGVLENGETQVWRYGDHTLTVWMHEKKTFCQVDDGEEIALWTQKALEKVQKQIEKMD